MESFSVGYYLKRFGKRIFFTQTDIKSMPKLVLSGSTHKVTVILRLMILYHQSSIITQLTRLGKLIARVASTLRLQLVCAL